MSDAGHLFRNSRAHRSAESRTLEGQVFILVAGEERAGLDWPLVFAGASKLSGVLIAPDGRVLTLDSHRITPSVAVTAEAATSGATQFGLTPLASVDLCAGRFTISNLIDGSYVVKIGTISAGRPSQQNPWLSDLAAAWDTRIRDTARISWHPATVSSVTPSSPEERRTPPPARCRGRRTLFSGRRTRERAAASGRAAAWVDPSVRPDASVCGQ